MAELRRRHISLDLPSLCPTSRHTSAPSRAYLPWAQADDRVPAPGPRPSQGPHAPPAAAGGGGHRLTLILTLTLALTLTLTLTLALTLTLTLPLPKQAEAVIVEFAQQEFAYFTSVPERPAGAVAGGKPTSEWSVPYLPPPSVPYLSPQARWRAASPLRSGVPPTSLCTGAPRASPTCGTARARCGSRAGSRSTRAATRARSG